jgi:type IV pilus assembly protein PilA
MSIQRNDAEKIYRNEIVLRKKLGILLSGHYYRSTQPPSKIRSVSMKPEFQAKFLQYLSSREKDDEGFTLIELLVVIIIIGILAAIALPSLLGQANKAKQSEARNNVGAVGRAQQAYYLENQEFSNALVNLGIGIKTQTVNYYYQSVGDTTSQIMNNWGIPQKTALKAYVARSYSDLLSTTAGSTESTTLTVVCESLSPAPSLAAINSYTWNGAPTVGNSQCSNLTNFATLGWKDLGG